MPFSRKVSSKERATMKHVSSIRFLAIPLILSICMSPKSLSAENRDKILIIIKESYGIDSGDRQFMETDEAILMKQTLEPGFDSHRYTKTNITNNIIKIQGGQKMV